MSERAPPKGEKRGGARKRGREVWDGERGGGRKRIKERGEGVVGSLARRWEMWRDWLGEREEVLEWVREGLRFWPRNAEELKKKGCLRPILLEKEQREWAVKELERLVLTGAVVFLGEGEDMPEGLWFASPVFTVPKPGPKRFRLVVDMRRLNEGLEVRKFKFERVEEFVNLLGRGWYMFTMDLAEGYFHQLLEEETRTLYPTYIQKVLF